jgi:hypothetical protein
MGGFLMLRFGFFLGTLGLGLLIVAVITSVRYLDPTSGPQGAGQPGYRFAVELDAAQIDAELMRLRALPGETLPANLGVVAGAKTACIVAVMGDKPNKAAIEAATRYFTVVFAIQERAASPLIDPRAQDFEFGIADSPDELRAKVESGEISERQVQRWIDLVSDYLHASHPLYGGLKLDQGGWAYTDFTKILALGRLNWERIAPCYRARTGG